MKNQEGNPGMLHVKQYQTLTSVVNELLFEANVDGQTNNLQTNPNSSAFSSELIQGTETNTGLWMQNYKSW